MSDLTYLFRQSKIKQSTPSKRLFQDERSRYRPKQKPIVKVSTSITTNSHNFPVEQLSKRNLSKHNLKKELNIYNSQMLLTLLRKIFFFMVAIIAFNILVTGTDQSIICANLAMGLMLLDLHIGWDPLGSWWFRSAQILVKVVVYCLNFQLFFAYVLKKDNVTVSLKVEQIVAVNAGMNYMLFMFLQPILTLQTIKNCHTPYMTFFQILSTQITRYFASFKTIYLLFRPILFLNLAYALLIVLLVIKTQDETLFYQLFSLACLKALVVTTFVLHMYWFGLRLIDRSIRIELIACNRKEINLNLLRLDEENRNNCDILRQIERYIWASSENFWDMEFLAHRYTINYDLIENHILRTLAKLEKQVHRLNINLANSKTQSSSEKHQNISYTLFPQIYSFIQTLQNKVYLLFIIDQIGNFEQMGTTAPIHMDLILKSTRKIAKSINHLQKDIPIKQIKKCFNCITNYLENLGNLQQ